MRKKAGMNIFLVILAIAAGLYLSRKPWVIYQEQQRNANVANREMRDAEKSHEELRREAAQIDSPLGRETLARDRGYTKPGETPVDTGK